VLIHRQRSVSGNRLHWDEDEGYTDCANKGCGNYLELMQINLTSQGFTSGERSPYSELINAAMVATRNADAISACRHARAPHCRRQSTALSRIASAEGRNEPRGGLA
jgi:hypothetical protein